jgi:hypothetical protein
LGTPDEGMKEEGGKSGLVEWICVPWSLVRMECWSCAKLCRCVGVGIGGSCDPFAVLGPSFGGWELAEVSSFVRSSLWSS